MLKKIIITKKLCKMDTNNMKIDLYVYMIAGVGYLIIEVLGLNLIC